MALERSAEWAVRSSALHLMFEILLDRDCPLLATMACPLATGSIHLPHHSSRPRRALA